MYLNQVFEDEARQLLCQAEEEARILKSEHITSACLFIALLRSDNGEVQMALIPLGFTVEAARSQVQQITGLGEWTHSAHLVFSRGSFQILGRATIMASRGGPEPVGVAHIMRAIFTEPRGVIEQLLKKTIQAPVPVVSS